MKTTLFIVLALLPLAAGAQGPGRGMGRGAGPRPCMNAGEPEPERRMRLTRMLGLAEALDLDEAQALKLRGELAKFDEKRAAAARQLREAHQLLRRAASGEKLDASTVDQAVRSALEARRDMDAADRDAIAAAAKDLPPEKRARAVLFLDRLNTRRSAMEALPQANNSATDGHATCNGMFTQTDDRTR